jgi:hypothetical protein
MDNLQAFIHRNSPDIYGWAERCAAADFELLTARATARQRFELRPRVGDFVRFPNEPELRRIAHDWETDVQPTVPKFGTGSYYIGKGGGCSMSGALDTQIPVTDLHDTGEFHDGSAWFFSGDMSGAHRGVTGLFPFRVWEYRAKVTCPLCGKAVWDTAEYRGNGELTNTCWECKHTF